MVGSRAASWADDELNILMDAAAAEDAKSTSTSTVADLGYQAAGGV